MQPSSERNVSISMSSNLFEDASSALSTASSTKRTSSGNKGAS